MAETAEPAEWPYDADQHDPLTALRIPVVGSAWPGWAYIVALDSGRLDDECFRPTDVEAARLRSFLDEYIAYFYNESYKVTLAELPFDIDGGAAGRIFRKWGPDDWGYRISTWQRGPTYVPAHPRIRAREKNPVGPLTLVKVMDRIHTHGIDEPCARWVEWKAAHPEVFGGAR